MALVPGIHPFLTVLSQHAAMTALVLGGLLLSLFYRHFFARPDELAGMRGPRNTSLLRGNRDRLNVARTLEWQEMYGRTFKTHAMFSMSTLFTSDLTALQHILNRDEIYQKAPIIRWGLSEMLGRGLLVLEDEEHAKLRRIMSPAFSPSQVKLLTPLFLDKAMELVAFWSPTNNAGWTQFNVVRGLKAVTLDIIGLAGFGYNFHALAPGGDGSTGVTALGSAFRALFESSQTRVMTPVRFLRGVVPGLRNILPAPKHAVEARKAMERVGMELLLSAKRDEDGAEDRRDLLSLLVKSNMAESEGQRLSDEVVVAQIPTFFIAGHETTSTSTAWALRALAAYPEVQSALRSEVQSLGTDSPSFDTLQGLPYLDHFVREVMRLHAPVSFTNRLAMRDDVIPLSKDGAWTDVNGVVHESIIVKKGQNIQVPIGAVNRDRTIWGADADEFRPERWASPLPAGAASVPGVYSHQLTFLGGPHNCIGWRFSLAEMKSLLFVLVRELEFALPDGWTADDIVPASNAAVQRPMLRARPEEGTQLPLRVRRIGV